MAGSGATRGFSSGLRPIVSTAESSDSRALVRHQYASTVVTGREYLLSRPHRNPSEFSLLSMRMQSFKSWTGCSAKTTSCIDKFFNAPPAIFFTILYGQIRRSNIFIARLFLLSRSLSLFLFPSICYIFVILYSLCILYRLRWARLSAHKLIELI